MKKLVGIEAAMIFVGIVDELQLVQEILPHWLKVLLPLLGGLAIVIKIKWDKKHPKK